MSEKIYSWQQSDWPNFSYNLTELDDLILKIIQKAGYSEGALLTFSDSLQAETIIDFMTMEAIKSSEIEGEYFSREDVMSSIKNHLGLHTDAQYPIKKIQDAKAEGIAQLMVDVRRSYQEPLTQEKLFQWHTMLFQQPSMFHPILAGAWRNSEEPMQIVSGRYGHWTVHYEAPPSKQVSDEMAAYIDWFNQATVSAPVRAAIAHLYFESIHPFEDGNGRIGRALAEKAFSQGIGKPVLFSLSKTIESNKNAYYQALKEAQRSNDITHWIQYFLTILLAAQNDAETQINFIVRKTRFLDHFKEQLNQRELKVILRVFDEGPEGFLLNARKYMSISRTSKATATRDLQNLLAIGALKQAGKGRSVSYEMVLG